MKLFFFHIKESNYCNNATLRLYVPMLCLYYDSDRAGLRRAERVQMGLELNRKNQGNGTPVLSRNRFPALPSSDNRYIPKPGYTEYEITGFQLQRIKDLPLITFKFDLYISVRARLYTLRLFTVTIVNHPPIDPPDNFSRF